MHKKLKNELESLAHHILQMETKDDVSVLHKKARDIYEQLSVLKYLNEFKVSNTVSEESKETFSIELDKVKEPAIQPLENLKEGTLDNDSHDDKNLKIEKDLNILKYRQQSLEEELKIAISSDEATNLFEKVIPVKNIAPNKEVTPKKADPKKRSLNDSLLSHNLQIGLNDRIAFVKHLFNGNQEDFNRVLSQLNSFKLESEAKNFVAKYVKPDYDWTDKEEYELRLTNLIERKFS